MEAMSIRLTHALYKEHFLDVRPRKMPRTSQYGVCFAALLAAMTRRVIQEGKNHRLSVVIEGGHPNAAETAHLFKQYQERLQNDGHDILRTHTLALKADAPLLMIADVIAYSGARDWRAINAGAKPHYSERNMVPPKKDEVGWTVLDVTPETLRDMIQRYNDERAHAHQDYLNRRRDASTSRVSG
jgi:hypothetical protein